MSRKMPKILYRYDLAHLNECKLLRYKIQTGDEFTYTEEQRLGTWLYRARQGIHHDFYGYATLEDAKKEYLLEVRKEIGQLQAIIKKMEKK